MELWVYVLISIGAVLVAFLLGLSTGTIRRQYRNHVLRSFWGKAALGKGLIMCYGALTDSRLMQPDPPPFRYIKRFHDGRALQMAGPSGTIPSTGDMRAVTYLINSLRTYRRRPVVVLDDTTSFSSLSRSIIAVGNPFTNEVIDLIVREPANNFVEFGREGNNIFILDKKSQKRFESSQVGVRKDYGVILRLPNSRFRGHTLFACAGLGEWGTSGAAWYLARQWRNLRSEFAGPFAVIVEVEMGCDESTRRVVFENKKRSTAIKAPSG